MTQPGTFQPSFKVRGEGKFMENERRLNIHFFGQLGNWSSSFIQGRVSEQEREKQTGHLMPP